MTNTANAAQADTAEILAPAGPDSSPESAQADCVLIEEVSIDGLCGVY